MLRDLIESDLAVFFDHQQDPDARRMAAFTSKDPSDRDAFNAHWRKILDKDSIVKKTIVSGGRVAGHILAYEESGHTEVTYWIGREFWGRGLATAALRDLLKEVTVRPLRARAARDNVASLRVLEKCGFRVTAEERGFANARGGEIDEFVLFLE